MERFQELRVSCPTGVSLLMPSEYDRVYFGCTPLGANPGSYCITMLPNLYTAPDTNSPNQLQYWPLFEMKLDQHGMLVWQEWWVRNSGVQPINFQVITRYVWEGRRKKKRISVPFIGGLQADPVASGDVQGATPAGELVRLKAITRALRGKYAHNR